MTKEDIYEALKQGERMNMECKRAKGGLPDSLWDTYSAFANTNGGLILLGVSEDSKERDITKRFVFTGVPDAVRMKKDLWNTINNGKKISINLLKDEDVDIVSIDGADIICVNVPRADYSLRPVYINDNPVSGTYKRNGEGDYHCTKAEVAMMMRDASDQGNDGKIVEHYDMNDVDEETLRAYRQFFQNRNPNHVWNRLDDKLFLIRLGGYVLNRGEDKEGLTLAGLFMFGKGQSINEVAMNIRLDYVEKVNLIGDQRYSYRLTDDGTWENNFFNFISMVLPRLTRDLPRPFKMEGMVRVDDTPQHMAVREAMVNMLIHSDVMLNGVIKVEKLDNALVFTNPGLLMLPVEQIYAGGESKARNQRMQKMLRMIGFGENLGSGFPLILDAWHEKHWMKPTLIEQPELMQVKLVLRPMNEGYEPINGVCEPVNGRYEPVNENEKLVFDPVNGMVKPELTDRQKRIIKLIKDKPSITRLEVASALNSSDSTIKREFATLVKMDVIEREGSDKKGSWKIKINLSDFTGSIF